MKSILFLIILGLCTPISFSYSDDYPGICDSVYVLAETIMTKRQENISITDMLSTSRKGDRDDSVRQLSESFIIDAYQRPRMSVAENQMNSIKDFANEKYLNCRAVAAKQRANQ